MIDRIFVLIPSPHPTGPIKGAYALANALVDERPVTLVTLKHGPGAAARLDPRVDQLSLADVSRGWWNAAGAYRAFLRKSGGRDAVGSISMCLSADVVNCLSARDAITCASVRGNLWRNYRLDYGISGVPVAAAHLSMLRRADHIVAITRAMAAQIASFTRRRPAVIGNFIDEAALEPYRLSTVADGPLRFVFVASLSARKQPLVAVRAIAELARRGVDATLDVVGTGPLAKDVAAEITREHLERIVTLHGYLADPYPLIASADALVLPSLSEGIARSALEALHLGVPCVLRDVDGNATLVTDPRAGALFGRDNDLADTLLAVARRARLSRGPRVSLLPPGFRQREEALRYLGLLEQRR